MKLKSVLSFLSLILTVSIVHAQSISITGSTINTSNTVTTGLSALGDYTLNWSGLSGNITLTSNDANVEFSNDGGSSFNTSLSISSGLGSAIIEIRINPSSANGTNSVTLTNTSVSNPSTFTTLNFNYTVIASTQPTINSTLLTSNVSANGMDLSFTGGDGSKRIVVAKAGSAVDFIPTDGVAPLTANANINLAGDLGNGNKLIYDGSGSGMAVTGLSHNTTYHFAVFEYNEGTNNSQNYFTSSFSTANQATTEQPLVIANDNGTTLNTNFDNISNTLTSNFVPNGWYLAEQGGNTTYDVSDGTTTTENSYSFGSTSSTDRAIGSITESTITPVYFGTKLYNNSGATVTSIFIEYIGEQWRLGATGRTDKLAFQYSTNATSITDNLATWTAVTALDFTAPVTTGSVGALNGNLSANQTIVSGDIESISIPNSGTVWLRWADNDVTGNDDGLAIDEVNITPFSNTATGNLSTSTYSNINVTDNVTLTQNTTVNNTVNVKPGKTVNLNGHNLIINGAIIGSPIFVGNSTSALTLAGTGAIGNIRFDQTTPGTTNVIKDFTVNKTGKTVTLENALQIADNGTVTVTAGTLASGGNLTLASTLTGTARIAELGAGANITGNVEVQRYMVGGATSQRGWRCMSTPVSGATYAQLVDDIFITGPGGTGNGFDANGSNSSVMYYEESATRGWKSITNPTNTWDAGKGALVFFRGDRTQTSSLTNTSVAPNSFALDYSGTINSGDVTVALDFNSAGLVADQGWNLIGNPYPSQIDWANVNRSVNTDSYYYILNPNTKNYVSQNTGTLAIGQAFFVLVDAATSITFQENDKTANTGTAYFKTAVNPLTIKMKLDNVQYDVATLNFESNSSKNYVFKEDAIKLKNSVYNLAFVTPNNREVQYNVVNYLGTTGTDTFDLNVTSTTNNSYTLNFTNFDEVPLTKAILLVDKLNNNLVNLRITPDYTFTINNSTSTTFGNRFALVITDQYTPLPVKLTTFAGKKLANANQLSWTTASEKNMVAFEIERSNDGKNFEPIGLVKPTNTNTNNNYTFNDITAQGKVNYYRLKMVDAKNTDYSNVVSIANNEVTQTIDVYPNPTNKYLTINVPQGETIVGVEIFSVNGTSLLKADNQNILDVSTLEDGLYLVVINTLSGKSQVKFLKN